MFVALNVLHVLVCAIVVMPCQFDEAGDLYVGNDIALNIRAAEDGAVSRIDGGAGLPYANISSIVTSVSSPPGGASQLWLGTDMGIVVRSSDPAADPEWRYLYGPRWHPGKSVSALEAVTEAGGVSSTTVFAATDGGVVFIEQQLWTLARKAKVMQAALARHDRHGLTAECTLSSPGNISGCLNGEGNGARPPRPESFVCYFTTTTQICP